MNTQVFRKMDSERISDLWCWGWHVSFSAGGRPVASKGDPPREDDVEEVAEELLEPKGEDQVNIEVNGWVVGFLHGEEPLLMPLRSLGGCPKEPVLYRVYGSRLLEGEEER